jgi:two-component sensor histidine kinase
MHIERTQVLLAQAGIDAKERETADKLQKLILEALHHRIKNTLATVSAITSQSLRTATSIEHGQHAKGRLVALGRAHDSDGFPGRAGLKRTR